MTFVIVGGGPTGVELAGTLARGRADDAGARLPPDRHAHARVILVEAEPRVLPPYAEDLSERPGSSSRRWASRCGPDAGHGHRSPKGSGSAPSGSCARTVLWAAGVAASPLGRTLGVPLDRAGRVLVEPDLTIPGHPNVYVIGDLAHFEQDGKPVPGVAPAAMQMGKHAARN